MNNICIVLTILVQLFLPLLQLQTAASVSNCVEADCCIEELSDLPPCCRPKLEEQAHEKLCCCNPSAEFCKCKNSDADSSQGTALPPGSIRGFKLSLLQSGMSKDSCFMGLGHSKFEARYKSRQFAIFDSLPAAAIRYLFCIWLL